MFENLVSGYIYVSGLNPSYSQVRIHYGDKVNPTRVHPSAQV